MLVYICTHIYICISHQIVRFVNWHKGQHELFHMVFPVQHSYLDTSTSKADYIITFLGLWELCFAVKTIHTSWPSFSLVSKMSEKRQERQTRSQLRLKRIISEKHREINELLKEVNSRNITKDRKEEINILLADLYEQLHETEQALVLISS